MRWIPVIMLFLLATSCEDDDNLFAPPASVSEDIFDHINHHRLVNGYVALDKHDTLIDLAATHAQTMAEANEISHVNETDRYETVINQLSMTRYGTLTASGQINGKDIISRWSDDEASNNTILGDYAYIGVGVAENGDKKYASVIFAK